MHSTAHPRFNVPLLLNQDAYLRVFSFYFPLVFFLFFVAFGRRFGAAQHGAGVIDVDGWVRFGLRERVVSFTRRIRVTFVFMSTIWLGFCSFLYGNGEWGYGIWTSGDLGLGILISSCLSYVSLFSFHDYCSWHFPPFLLAS